VRVAAGVGGGDAAGARTDAADAAFGPDTSNARVAAATTAKEASLRGDVRRTVSSRIEHARKHPQ